MPGPADAPQSAEEALARARHHAGAAAAEALRAGRCLLDAAFLATAGVPSSSHRSLVRIAGALDELAASLDREPGEGVPPAWGEAVLDALDHEIRRWEARSRDDAEARAVLRAFLGLREILWEVGLRPAPDPEGGGRGKAAAGGGARAGRPDPADAHGANEPDRPRVQRVRVQG